MWKEQPCSYTIHNTELTLHLDNALPVNMMEEVGFSYPKPQAFVMMNTVNRFSKK